jgi:hypothetical protein
MKKLLLLIPVVASCVLYGCGDRAEATRSPEPVTKPTAPTVVDANPNMPPSARKALQNVTSAPPASAVH